MQYTLKSYFCKYKINAQEFTDIELEAILSLCNSSGIENSFYTAQSFRNAEFHYLTAVDHGDKVAKCSQHNTKRVNVSREQVIDDLKLYEKSSVFIKQSTTETDSLVVSVYSSGHPHYFTYAFDFNTKVTYCLVGNQFWVRASQNFTEKEIFNMLTIQQDVEIVVN